MPAAASTGRNGAPGGLDYISVVAGGHTFGIPVACVQDVFVPHTITRVPLAPPEIAGVLNLRGRIVTAVDLNARLGLPPAAAPEARLAVGTERGGEAYGILIDGLGDVLSLAPEAMEPNPAHLDPHWSAISRGVYRLNGTLLVVLDVERVLDFDHRHEAA
jgi:purine-binding chemotaxis protein CheW